MILPLILLVILATTGFGFYIALIILVIILVFTVTRANWSSYTRSAVYSLFYKNLLIYLLALTAIYICVRLSVTCPTASQLQQKSTCEIIYNLTDIFIPIFLAGAFSHWIAQNYDVMQNRKNYYRTLAKYYYTLQSDIVNLAGLYKYMYLINSFMVSYSNTREALKAISWSKINTYTNSISTGTFSELYAYGDINYSSYEANEMDNLIAESTNFGLNLSSIVTSVNLLQLKSGELQMTHEAFELGEDEFKSTLLENFKNVIKDLKLTYEQSLKLESFMSKSIHKNTSMKLSGFDTPKSITELELLAAQELK